MNETEGRKMGSRGERDDKGGPQESEYRRGQRRDEVRPKYDSGHFV